MSPDLRIARQGIKLKFADFQQTTQEHVHQVLDKADLLKTAELARESRREGRGVRLVGACNTEDPQQSGSCCSGSESHIKRRDNYPPLS